MHFSFIAAAALMCAPTASAYFRVYLGGSNDPYGGGTGDMAQFFYEDPDCGTVESRPRNFNGNGDVRRDGWACEGCSPAQAPQDFNIAKFEMSATTDDFNAKRRVIEQQVGIVVATQNNGGDYYDLTVQPEDGGDERRVGWCQRVYNGDDYFCSQVLTTLEGVHVLNCFPETETLDLYFP